MRVGKVETPDSITSEQQSFKAVKLKTANIKKASRTLTTDTFELRKTLPDNKGAKDFKYFGNPDIGPSTGGEHPQPSDKEMIAFVIAWGASIAAAILM